MFFLSHKYTLLIFLHPNFLFQFFSWLHFPFPSEAIPIFLLFSNFPLSFSSDSPTASHEEQRFFLHWGYDCWLISQILIQCFPDFLSFWKEFLSLSFWKIGRNSSKKQAFPCEFCSWQQISNYFISVSYDLFSSDARMSIQGSSFFELIICGRGKADFASKYLFFFTNSCPFQLSSSLSWYLLGHRSKCLVSIYTKPKFLSFCFPPLYSSCSWSNFLWILVLVPPFAASTMPHLPFKFELERHTFVVPASQFDMIYFLLVIRTYSDFTP